MRRARVVIVGAGVSGLAAAYRLTRLAQGRPIQLELVVLEASDAPGGAVSTEYREGFVMERGPDCFISTKPAGVRLADELGMGGELIGTSPSNRRSFIARSGRLHPVPEGFHLLAPSKFWPFVTSGLFSLTGKLRMGLDLLLPRRTDGQEESLEQFVVRRLGREALDWAAQPMVGGIYTADPRHLSLKAAMPQFIEMERAHRSLLLAMLHSRRSRVRDAASRGTAAGPRYDLFVTFKRGLQTLVDELVARLPEGCLRTNVRVSRLVPGTAGWRLFSEGQLEMDADAVCVAVDSAAASRLLEQCAPELAGELEAIPRAGTVTANFAFERRHIAHRLDGMGFVVPHKEKRTLLACTFSSQKFAGRAPEGDVLLRAFAGGAMQPEVLELTDEELRTRLMEDISMYLGVRAQPRFVSINRHPASMPQYVLGHLDRVARVESRLAQMPRFALAGNALRGVGIPDCIESGERAAGRLMDELSGEAAPRADGR